MAIIFNKTTFEWNVSDVPETLPDIENWLINPIFIDEERCNTFGPRYWVYEKNGEQDTIRCLTDQEIDTNISFINEAKTVRRTEVNLLRDQKFADGFVDGNGIHWNASPQDVLNLNGVCTLISLGVVTSDQTWRDADNVNHTLTVPELVTLAGYMAVFAKTVYAVSWTHKANIDACTTLADVVSYDITTGW